MEHKKPYQHTFEYAVEHNEAEAFHEDSQINRACVKAIDEAIRASNHDMYYYNVGAAADVVVKEYGIDRVNWCMAGLIQRHQSDGRYSRTNKEWAGLFNVPRNKYTDFVFDSHPTVLDGFIDAVRKVHREIMLDAVGNYEHKHRMADRNRLTWFKDSACAYNLKPDVTVQQLSERYTELMDKKAEKQSVLAQIKAARSEQKKPSAPGSERSKKKSEPEL